MKPMPDKNQDGIAGIARRADQVRQKMRVRWTLFEELAHYFHHMRTGFLVEREPDQEFDPDIWDASPERHRAKLSSEFAGAMWPKDRYVIGLEPADAALAQDDEVRLWCQLAAYYMQLVMSDPKANWIERLNELADDICAFGSGVIYVDYDAKNKCMLFQVMHLKNFCFEVDELGNVTRCYCWWQMTLEDLVKRFGLENLPDELQEEWRKPGGDYCKSYEVLHAIVPNDDFARYGMGPGRLPFASIWILKEGTKQLGAKGGFHEIPYILVRWYKRSDEAWGRSDCDMLLPDARLMQSVAGALLEITEKQGNPPMQAPIDILRGEVQLFPGGLTGFDASGFQYQGDPLRPVEIGANPAMTAEYLQYLDKKIGKALYADLLNIPDEGLTEEQRMAMQAMKAIILAPLWSRVENEVGPPILDRVFNFMMRMRALPPVPEKLVGQRLVYKFDNHISDMRELAKAQQSMQALAMPLSLEVPEIVAVAVETVDWETAFRDMWQKTRIPANYLKPREQVAAERQQREQQMQMAQMAEMAKSAGPGVKSAIEGAVTAKNEGLLPAPQ